MNMLKIHVTVVPHDQQRYPTVGDWTVTDDGIDLRVSQFPDPRYEQLIALHELVEALLCHWTGVNQHAVDAFDKAFTDQDIPGEPGDSPLAPYRHQHAIASVAERLAADLLGVDWNAYNKAIEDIFTEPHRPTGEP